jgi:hypothetical protein
MCIPGPVLELLSPNILFCRAGIRCAAQLPSVLARAITISVSGSQIQVYSSITFAADFITSWNTVDSGVYSVAVTKISTTMVALTGDSSHYTATVWEDAFGNIKPHRQH